MAITKTNIKKIQKIEELKKQALLLYKTKNIIHEKKAINDLILRIKKLLKKHKIQAKIKLGGSAAKSTFLGNNFDVDIFVMFNRKKYLNADISKILGNVLKPLKPVKIHGSRDYYQIKQRYEIIPVLEVKKPSEIVNVTDASTLHVDWVKNKISKAVKKNKTKEDIVNEIKIAKLFFKGIGVYGAESYIKGISGHVTDILVLHYGSFIEMLKNIAKWKDHTEIDPENHKTVLDKSKISGPLVLIDPIQPNRNAAAALGEEKYKLLIKKTKQFLNNPTIDYFIEKKPTLDELKKEYNVVLIVKPIGKKIEKRDLIGAKLMKGFEFIKKQLRLFDVKKSEWFWDKGDNCFYAFKTGKENLDEYYIHKGPSINMKDHCNKFKEKYGNSVIEKNGILYAKVKRKFTHIEDVLKNIFQDVYLKDKIRCIEIAK